MIICDRSEPLEIVEELQKFTSVEVASSNRQGFLDYTWWDFENHPDTIERKEVHDLSNRVNDLERQLLTALELMKKFNGHVGLLIEGIMEPIENSTVLYRQKKSGTIFYQSRLINRPYSYYSRFLIRLWTKGIPVFHTCSKKETAYFLADLAKTRSKDPESSHIFKKVYVEAMDRPQLKVLVAMGYSQRVAQELLDSFGTVKKVIQQPREKLLEVKGIGEATLHKVNTALGGK